MPNGLDVSDEEFAKLESPLLEIDEILKDFARTNNMRYSKNYHDFPERSLRWGNEIEKLIQISLHDIKLLTFDFWICASQDRKSGRYWKHQHLKNNVPIIEIKNNLIHLLNEGRRELDSFSENELKFATYL